MREVSICVSCDEVIEENIVHSCIKGLTDNINRLHNNINLILTKDEDKFFEKSFTYGTIFGIQLAQSIILGRGKYTTRDTNQFAIDIGRELQDKMDNLSTDDKSKRNK